MLCCAEHCQLVPRRLGLFCRAFGGGIDAHPPHTGQGARLGVHRERRCQHSSLRSSPPLFLLDSSHLRSPRTENTVTSLESPQRQRARRRRRRLLSRREVVEACNSSGCEQSAGVYSGICFVCPALFIASSASLGPVHPSWCFRPRGRPSLLSPRSLLTSSAFTDELRCLSSRSASSTLRSVHRTHLVLPPCLRFGPSPSSSHSFRDVDELPGMLLSRKKPCSHFSASCICSPVPAASPARQ